MEGNINVIESKQEFIFKSQNKKITRSIDIHQNFSLTLWCLYRTFLHHCKTHLYPTEKRSVYLTLPKKPNEERQNEMAGLGEDLRYI